LNIYEAVTLAKGGNLVPDWVTINPMGGMVNPGESTAIDLTFTSPQETGTYTATLMLVGDDPYNPDVRIPLTMDVSVPPIMQTFIPILRK
jgi:hypothetical protein